MISKYMLASFFCLLTLLVSTSLIGQRPLTHFETTSEITRETPITGNTIWNEDFENASSLPYNGITTTTQGTDAGFVIASSSGSSWKIPAHSTYALTNDDLCNCDKSNDILELPSQDFTSQHSVFFECDIFHDMSSGDGIVYLDIDTGNSWQTIDSVGAAGNWRLFQSGLPNYQTCGIRRSKL